VISGYARTTIRQFRTQVLPCFVIRANPDIQGHTLRLDVILQAG